MIPAEKTVLAEQQTLERLMLTQTEVQLMRDDYNAMATTAALLAGFAFTGAADIDVPDAMDDDVKLVYYICIALTMVLMMYCVVTATICVVLGPDMLVNGAAPNAPKQHIRCIVNRATAGMRIARDHIFSSFVAGLILMLVSTCLVTMSKVGFSGTKQKIGAFAVVLVFGLGCFAMVVTVQGMYRVFDARPQGLVAREASLCTVCGRHSTEGVTDLGRRFWAYWIPRSIRRRMFTDSFQCYECVGQRYHFTPRPSDCGGGGGLGPACAEAVTPRQSAAAEHNEADLGREDSGDFFVVKSPSRPPARPNQAIHADARPADSHRLSMSRIFRRSAAHTPR
eukprot:TRINITY_DN970_c0_g1_i1.p1 TRINITY_DN970_c0_g1~~TRINITY_DN970_c0_g1_i1.p1  ORF type:complete len:338 (+),score=84.53 TRINITY_DN970_c0_g1_i1:62-1075(+)